MAPAPSPPSRKRKAEDRGVSVGGGVGGGGSPGPLADLTSLLGEEGFGADGIAVREHPSGGMGMFASRDLAAGEAVGGEAGLPAESVLDPAVVLAAHPTALAAAERGGASARMAFWMALAAMAADAEARATEVIGGGGEGGESRHDAYLRSLPRVAPDPMSWSSEEREALLGGTAVVRQTERELARLRAQYAEVVGRMRPEGKDAEGKAAPKVAVPPFDVGGIGAFPSVLWARGVHWSRSFPRSLKDAAFVASNDGTPGGAVLRVRLGDWRAPRIAYSGPRDTATGAEVGANTVDGSGPGRGDGDGGGELGEDKGAEVLGIMLPFYDLLDHRCGHPISWEAGGRRLRFRLIEAVPAGGPIWNNYGPKGNAELLHTYGFCVRNNPLDSVEGIVLGCPCPAAGGETGDEERLLHRERMALIAEHALPHSVGRGCLRLGPFSLHRQLPGQEGDGDGYREGGVIRDSVLPPELLFALAIAGMESVEEGPGVTLDEIEMLKDELTGRLKELRWAGKAAEGALPHTRAEFAAAYKDGQRELLQAALEELEVLAGGGSEEDVDQVNGSGA